MKQWLTAQPATEARRLLADQAAALLGEDTDIALSEIALRLPDPALIQPYRDLIEAARQVGVDAAYRPELARERLDDWMRADLKSKREMLAERRDELLNPAAAAVLAAWLEADPENPRLIFHDALLDLARIDRAALAFDALSEPDRAPARLAARTGDFAALAPLTLTLTQLPEPIRAAVWFHRAIALALESRPQYSLSAVQEARRLDPEQVTARPAGRARRQASRGPPHQSGATPSTSCLVLEDALPTSASPTRGLTQQSSNGQASDTESAPRCRRAIRAFDPEHGVNFELYAMITRHKRRRAANPHPVRPKSAQKAASYRIKRQRCGRHTIKGLSADARPLQAPGG